MNRLQEPQRLGIVLLRCSQQVTLEVGDLSGEMTDKLEIGFDAAADMGVGELGK